MKIVIINGSARKVEWKLDDYLVKDDYRYMLTGFCARKAKDDENQNAAGDAAAIEYFNYVIFYRHYNDNDIVNLPLSDGKERITWPGLKNYLRNLSRKDYQLQVHLFERKGEYQRFISFGICGKYLQAHELEPRMPL